MTKHATIDFETYGEAGFDWSPALNKWVPPEGGSATNRGLSLVGVVNYTRHPSFEVLCCWYKLPGHAPAYWAPGLPDPQPLFDYVAAGGIVEAHNMAFEHRVFQALGWPEIPLGQQRCSMAKSRAWALPGSLKDAAKVVGSFDKNEGGKKGIQMFCVPKQPTAKNRARRLFPHDKPADFQTYIVDYCADDVKAEEALSAAVPELSPQELEHWQIDQTINRRGIRVDVPTLRACRKILRTAWRTYGERCVQLTGGIKPSEVQQLIAWAAGHGVRFTELDDEALTEALKRPDLPAPVREMLLCRAAVASASVKKVHAALNVESDGRVYDLYNFHAARTGRPTSGKVQAANLPRGETAVWKCQCGKSHAAARCPWCGSPRPAGDADEWNPEAMEDCIELIQTGSMELVESAYGNALTAMAGCLRGMFIADDDKEFVSSDYTAIEAVVLACLAGEEWRIDLFRNKGKIYEASGAKIANIPYEEVLEFKKRTGRHHPIRKTGKVAELALGFQGGVGSWLAFDDSGERSEKEVQQVINKWRADSPAIVEFWGGQTRGKWQNKREEFYGVEGSIIRALMLPGVPVNFRGLVFESCEQEYAPRFPVASLCPPRRLTITLLSGRKLTYHSMVLEPSTREWAGRFSLSYEGFNTNPKNGPKGWIRMRTWGGRMTENIVQATANDILRFSMAALEAQQYPIVMHTYDEIVCEVPKGFGSVEELESIMKTLPCWAAGWPIGADGGWRGRRYRKG